MVHSSTLTLTLLQALLLPSALANGIYTKGSPVLQIDGRSYRDVIEKSNHTSIVEFYAPWCGHCKNLKPAYEKAAKSLTGLAKVAAVNCDEESNKPFCASMGVQGFPTLKIVRPGKKAGKPVVEDYQGQRNAKAIVDAVVEKIPNHVKRLKDGDYQTWLEDGEGPKAILFSEKGTTSALLKAIAVDYLGVMSVAQIRGTEKEAVEVFNVVKFPSMVLLPGEGKDPVHYEGEMKKEAMVKFLSQAAQPNPDPALKKDKPKSSSTNKSKSSKASSSFSKASASHASEDAKTAKASQTAESLQDDSNPTESPNPNVVNDETQKPIKVPDLAPPIASLPDGLSLQQQCLNTKAGTCILALLPETSSIKTIQAISALSEIHYKHEQAKRKLFPFYQLPHTNSQASALRRKLSLGEDVELIATNGKRSWYRHYTPTSPSSSLSQRDIEDWIDAIRMGDTPKSPIPSGLIIDSTDLPPEPVKIDFSNPEAMKGSLPEGVEMVMEEVDDDEYDRIMAQQGKGAGEPAKTEETPAVPEPEADVEVDDEPVAREETPPAPQAKEQPTGHEEL